MTNRMVAINSDERLALIGLFLMLVVARFVNHGGFLAQRVIDAVAVIGWITDHLPQPATSQRLRRQRPWQAVPVSPGALCAPWTAMRVRPEQIGDEPHSGPMEA
jgi:hypothetical protein